MSTLHLCCRSGGSNLNAGSRTGNTTVPGTAADLTYASGNYDGTSVFTVASGNPVTDGVVAGDLISIYANGATVTTLVAQVVSRTSTTITHSTTLKAGSTLSGTGNRTLKVGGAWAGPSSSTTFPFSISNWDTLADTRVQINWKNDVTYDRSTGAWNPSGTINNCGFTSAYNDLGLATWTSTGSGIPFAIGNANSYYADLIFLVGTTTGTNDALAVTAGRVLMRRCVVTGARGSGINVTGSAILEYCELYGNNVSNNSGDAGLQNTGPTTAIGCLFHHNTGSNTNGVLIGHANTQFIECTFANNGKAGVDFATVTAGIISFTHCNFYANTTAGIACVTTAGSTTTLSVMYGNFVSNSTYGVDNGDDVKGNFNFMLFKCAFYGNSSGETNFGSGASESLDGTTLSSSPFTDPANGDFSLNATSGGGLGLRDEVIETPTEYSSYGPYRTYRDRGGLQRQQTSSSGGVTVPTIGYGVQGVFVG